MATYKVPQNVETEDKLLGPFTLRQLIFVILFLASCWMAYLLFMAFPPLALLMLPFIAFFGVLGLARRKDQPIEIFLAAAARFYLKPHKRIWDQEGYDQHVIITAPKKVEKQRYRDISQDEVRSRLSQLAGIMDSRGWLSKGVETPSDRLLPSAPSPLSELDSLMPDMMDEQTDVSQKFNQLIEQRREEAKREAIEKMHATPQPQPVIQQPTTQTAQQVSSDDDTIAAQAHFAPYPTMHQKIVPTQAQATQDNQPAKNSDDDTTKQPVTQQPSPDIIRLANNNDLTVSAIAREAHSLPSEEVVISLR